MWKFLNWAPNGEDRMKPKKQQERQDVRNHNHMKNLRTCTAWFARKAQERFTMEFSADEMKRSLPAQIKHYKLLSDHLRFITMLVNS